MAVFIARLVEGDISGGLTREILEKELLEDARSKGEQQHILSTHSLQQQQLNMMKSFSDLCVEFKQLVTVWRDSGTKKDKSDLTSDTVEEPTSFVEVPDTSDAENVGEEEEQP